MQTLILPGYSVENKNWVDETAKNLKSNDTIRPFYWMHWTDSASKFEAHDKALLISKHLRGEKVNIIAKSISTLVIALVYNLIPNQLNKVILCGIPVNDITPEETILIKKFCLDMKDNILILQNMDDPHGKFEQIKDFGNVKLKVASDHNYPYFEEFNKFLN